MNLVVRLRRGEGPFWARLKSIAKAVLCFHLPVGPLSRPFFASLYLLHVAGREVGLWLLRFFWFEPLLRSQCASVGTGLRMEKLPYLNGRGKIMLGAYVELSGKPSFTFLNRWKDMPELNVGDYSFLGHNCSIAVGSSVRIGRHCLLASGVSIADYDGHPVDAALRRIGRPSPREAILPVVIGDDVWIGRGATILKGVSIGDRSIVAAQAVVTKSVPPDVVVAGNPARIVKTLSEFEINDEGRMTRPSPARGPESSP